MKLGYASNMKIKIKINTDLGKYKKDTFVTVEVDENDIPIDRYWRTRLADSKVDNCIEVVQEPTKENTAKSNKKRVE